jgi:hypothetical protein
LSSRERRRGGDVAVGRAVVVGVDAVLEFEFLDALNQRRGGSRRNPVLVNSICLSVGTETRTPLSVLM